MRIILELWPAFIPLLLYVAWMARKRRHAVRAGDALPGWMRGPWFWAVLAGIGIAVGCLLTLGVFEGRTKGDYVPPHMENGTLVPGEVRR